MIESELKADPQLKSTDKVEPKADKRAKAKGAASLIGPDKDLNNLEKAWSETASEMKAMQKTLQDITTCIGHLQQNRSPQPIPPTNNVNSTNQGMTTPKQGEGGSTGVEGVETEVEVKASIKIDLPFVGGARAMLVEKRNTELRTVPFIKNAGRIGGRHTQPIQTPPLLVILSRRKTRKEIH